ncbi:unnamed protein product [Clonostachys solani]|uniref:FAD dependent oxidoreductase domain-containing protein n=1 Tax=Clonostachys solani TaxID=160281 RepID=A0A9P0EG19_9HYPO|nr:unnamed protein product [Clonostachys solani]
MEEPSVSSTIVIIGAGVIGLSCALKLQSLPQFNGISGHEWRILLVAKEWPTSIPGAPETHSVNYASIWAGSHVRPIPATSTQLRSEATYLKQTVEEFERLLAVDPSVGLTRTVGVEYLDAPSPDYVSQTGARFEAESGLRGYRALGGTELPEGVALGFEYETFCINSPVYCRNLLRKLILQGGETLQRDLMSEWEAFSLVRDVELVVNASGVGFGDHLSFPTRGQIVLTNLTQASKTVTRQHQDGTWSFIIPRFFNGGTIVGGTKEPGEWNSEASMSTREDLLKAGEKLMPYCSSPNTASISKTEAMRVIADVVGRRPTRQGGMRVEVEEKRVDKGATRLPSRRVIHAYGAGGRGFELSWGVANEVAQLASQLISKSPSYMPRL